MMGNYKGILFSNLCGAAFTTNGIIAKYLQNVSLVDLLIYRYLFVAALSLPLLIACRDTRADWLFYKMFPIRCAFDCAAVYLRFTAFRMLPLGEAQILLFSSAIFSPILSRVILKERSSRLTYISVLITFIGVLLVAKLPEVIASRLNSETHLDYQHLIGITYGLVGSFIDCATVLIVRRFKHVHESLVVFNTNLTNFVIILIASFFINPVSWRMDCGVNSWGVVLAGAVSYCGNLFLTKALQTCQISAFIVLKLGSQIVLSISAQIFIFGDALTLYTSFAILFVVIGVLLASFQKWVSIKPVNHHIRRKIEFLLR